MSYEYWSEVLDRAIHAHAEAHTAYLKQQFERQFLLRHGDAIIRAAENLLQPIIRAQLALASREAELRYQLATVPLSNERALADPFERSMRTLDKSEALATRQIEFERRIRADRPEEADAIIERMRDLIDVDVHGNGR